MYGTTRIRVRYGETDRAGVVYHANYLVYFEIGRTEWLRGLDRSYRQMEEDGLMLTVIEANLRYLRPARYDDLLRIETRVSHVGGARVGFDYAIYHDGDGDLLCTGSTGLGAIHAEDGRACRLPADFRHRLERILDATSQ